MSPQQDSQRKEYIARINRVIDHIDRNLQQELTLDELARVANFSRFHFHRIFSAMMGEPLSQFIMRLRLEKAASQLLAHREKPITVVALDCGFSGSAAFAKAFKQRYGMNASQWREQGEAPDSKTGQMNSNSEKHPGKQRKAKGVSSVYSTGEWLMELDPATRTLTWSRTMTNMNDVTVEVKPFPEMTVAYVRHIGPYAGDGALFQRLFEKLARWAGPRGLFANPDTKVLTVYHDDPQLTDEEKLRTSACITIPAEMAVDGDIGKMTLDGGDYAVGHFEINEDQYGEAWNHVMGGWLPQSGYQPDDRLCFELNLNDPNKHPEGKHLVDICIPVKPL
jgi:AraC family transcriptional regulator